MFNLFNLGVGLLFGVIIAIIFLIFRRNRKKWFILIALVTVSILLGILISDLYIYPRHLANQFDQDIHKNDLFVLLEQKHPKEFNEFLTKTKDIITENKDVTEVQQASSTLINRLFYQNLKKAPDQDITAYLNNLLNLYEYLYQKDPSLIMKFEMGQPFSSDVTQDKEFNELLNKLLFTKKNIIAEEDKDFTFAPTKAEVQPYLKPIFENLKNKYGNDNVQLLLSGKLNTINIKTAPALIIDFYKGILGSGLHGGGTIMRYMANNM